VVLADENSVEAIYDLGISHNKLGIALPDGTPYPEHATDITGDRALEFLTHFNRVRDRDWSECSFLDLGCSEGSTTFEISQMGSTVYGVEGREDGIRRADVIKSILAFERTHFSVANVNDPSSFRPVDGIFNAGILYHLEDPITCLERCAENARLFVYLDTGHSPRSEAELQKSKFAAKFGKSYKLNFRSIELDAIDFAEPGNTAEKHNDGLRRGPRSGIGNSNSVWVSHESAIALMAELGFPHHETVKDNPKIPRLRTCFFRTRPESVEPILDFLKPLPKLLPRKEAFSRIRARDLDYLRRMAQPVLLIGREPLLSLVRRDLSDSSIEVGEQIILPGEDRTPRGELNQLTNGKGGLVVVAAPDVIQIIRDLVILDRFQYAFGSFAMALQQSLVSDPSHAHHSPPELPQFQSLSQK
jgi:Methyltransferase domain